MDNDLEYCFKNTMKLLQKSSDRENKLWKELKEAKQTIAYYKENERVLLAKAKQWFIKEGKLNPYLDI